MEPGGGHRSGAGSNKCTEVANGKHNTKIDKLLQHEEQEAQECQQKQNDCNNKSEREDTSVARTGQSPAGRAEDHQDDIPQPSADGGADSEDENEEDDDEEENEEGEEDEEDDADGGAADTKKKGHTH